jgi:Ty3 transposon capsid-like protein/Zinc knuckle
MSDQSLPPSSPIPKPSNPDATSSSSSSTSHITSPPPDPVNEDQLRRLIDYVSQLELENANLRGVVPPLAPPPPPPLHDPPSRRESVVGPRQVTPHPYSSFDASSLHRIAEDDNFSRRSAPASRPAQVRVNPPTKFDGKDEDVSKLENFITSMERYLRLYDIPTTSAQSYNVGALQLSDTASAWLRHIETRDPNTITSWDELKKHLRTRFAPVAQQQLAFRRLEAVVHRKGVSQLNHDFMEQLQLMPAYNRPEFDPIMIDMFMSALERGTNTRFILTTLRVKISEDPSMTLDKAMQVALLAEANQGRAYTSRSHSSFASAAVPSRSSYSSSSSTSSVPRQHSSSSTWRNTSSSQNRFSSSRFNRSPIKPPSFSSPQVKLHHTVVDSSNDYDPEDEYHDAAAALEREMDGDSDHDDIDRVPQFHQDTSDADDNQHDAVRISAVDPFDGIPSDVALNMIRFAKRFGDVNNLSADELDRRRRNNLCFNCGGVDHRARDCKKPKPSNGTSGGNNHKSQPNKKHF